MKNKSSNKRISVIMADVKWYQYIVKHNDKENDKEYITCIYLDQIASKSYLAELDFNFADEYKNTIELCGSLSPDSDITLDLIMDRLQEIKTLILDYLVDEIESGRASNARHIISRPPKTLINLFINRSSNIINNLETTKIINYTFYNFELVAYIPVLPNTVTTVELKAKRIDETFYRLPSSVEIIILNLMHMSLSVESWPINLKKLYIYVAYAQKNKKTDTIISPYIGMLPCNLQKLCMQFPIYHYYLDLPPNIIEFEFYTRSEYLYSLEYLPDTIEKLHLYLYSYPYINIKKLPANCKTLIYSRSNDMIKQELQERFPNVTITDKRLINHEWTA